MVVPVQAAPGPGSGSQPTLNETEGCGTWHGCDQERTKGSARLTR
jgi:hypothetical protein